MMWSLQESSHVAQGALSCKLPSTYLIAEPGLLPASPQMSASLGTLLLLALISSTTQAELLASTWHASDFGQLEVGERTLTERLRERGHWRGLGRDLRIVTASAKIHYATFPPQTFCMFQEPAWPIATFCLTVRFQAPFWALVRPLISRPAHGGRMVYHPLRGTTLWVGNLFSETVSETFPRLRILNHSFLLAMFVTFFR